MMTFNETQTYAEPGSVTSDQVDQYAKRGVTVTRDAASLILAALHNNAYEMMTRGGAANRDGAKLNKELAKSILECLR